MKETSKSIPRRLQDGRFITRYIIGDGIDIGCGSDPISLYGELFPLLRSLRTWDLPDGDAQFLSGIADESFDFVHSSHCLEHMHDPVVALKNWFRVLKPGGHLLILVPDEDLYERGMFPSIANSDHKWTFTLWKESSWCGKSINVVDLVKNLGPAVQPLKMELLDGTYRYSLPSMDQTLTPVGECAIEIIARKFTASELSCRGRLPRPEYMTNDQFFCLTGIQVRD